MAKKTIHEIPKCALCACMVCEHCERLGIDTDPREPSCNWAMKPWQEHHTSESWAKEIWKALEDVGIDAHDCIDVPFNDPYIGHFPIGTDREDIWRAIEETFDGVRVYDLMYGTGTAMAQDEVGFLKSEVLRWKKAYENEKAKVTELLPYARAYHTSMLGGGNVLEQIMAQRALDKLDEMT